MKTKKFRNLVILAMLVIFPVVSMGCLAAPLMYGGYALVSGIMAAGAGLFTLGALKVAMSDVREVRTPKSASTSSASSIKQLSWKKVNLKLSKDLAPHWDYVSTILRTRGVRIDENSLIVVEAVATGEFILVIAHKSELEKLDTVKVKYKPGNEKGALFAAMMALQS